MVANYNIQFKTTEYNKKRIIEMRNARIKIVVNNVDTYNKQHNATIAVVDLPEQATYTDELDLLDAIETAVRETIKNFKPETSQTKTENMNTAEQKLMVAIFGKRAIA